MLEFKKRFCTSSNIRLCRGTSELRGAGFLRILWNCQVINRNWGKYFGAASSIGLLLINELTYIDMTGAGKGRERKCEGPDNEVLG